MATLTPFGGLSEGITQGMGIINQALTGVGKISDIALEQARLDVLARQMRMMESEEERKKALFEPQLLQAQTQAEMARMSLEEQQRREKLLNAPISLNTIKDMYGLGDRALEFAKKLVPKEYLVQTEEGEGVTMRGLNFVQDILKSTEALQSGVTINFLNNMRFDIETQLQEAQQELARRKDKLMKSIGTPNEAVAKQSLSGLQNYINTLQQRSQQIGEALLRLSSMRDWLSWKTTDEYRKQMVALQQERMGAEQWMRLGDYVDNTGKVFTKLVNTKTGETKDVPVAGVPASSIGGMMHMMKSPAETPQGQAPALSTPLRSKGGALITTDEDMIKKLLEDGSLEIGPPPVKFRGKAKTEKPATVQETFDKYGMGFGGL